MLKNKQILHYAVFICFILKATLSAYAAEEIYPFKTDQQRQQFQDLSQQIRCVVCQNQSIADSNAPLANDFKNIIAERTIKGQSKQDIIDFMVSRYGEFVLYKPPLKKTTLLLWLGPFLLLLVVLFGIVIWLRQQRHENRTKNEKQASKDDNNITANDIHYAKSLLDMDIKIDTKNQQNND